MSVKPAERLRLGESSLPGLVVTQCAVEVGEPSGAEEELPRGKPDPMPILPTFSPRTRLAPRHLGPTPCLAVSAAVCSFVRPYPYHFVVLMCLGEIFGRALHEHFTGLLAAKAVGLASI